MACTGASARKDLQTTHFAQQARMGAAVLLMNTLGKSNMSGVQLHQLEVPIL
jgi:hypothetical protein